MIDPKLNLSHLLAPLKRIRWREAAPRSLALLLGATTLIALTFWISESSGDRDRCVGTRTLGIRLFVDHETAKGEYSGTILYDDDEIDRTKAPTALLTLENHFVGEGRLPTGGVWSRSDAAQSATGTLKGASYYKKFDRETGFATFRKAAFPFDEQAIALKAMVDVQPSEGSFRQVTEIAFACLKVAPGYKVNHIQELPDSQTYLFVVSRAPWFIAAVFCAVLLVWVPLFSAFRSGLSHGPLELIATLTYAAAIRSFFTVGADGFSPIALDFFLFLPLVLLGIFSLVGRSPSDRHPSADLLTPYRAFRRMRRKRRTPERER